MKREGDEGRKKKRRTKLRELDDEDFDLIMQNTGIGVKKKKRLQKVADQEGQENKVPIDSENEESRIKVKRDEDAELFDSEVADDSISRKRLINSANRRGIQESTNVVDQESIQRHQKIFGDTSTLDAKVKQNKRAAMKDKNAAVDESTLEGVYDADELDD